MNEPFDDLLELTEKALDYLESKLFYSTRTASNYKRAWNQIVEYMLTNNLKLYDEDVGTRFLVYKFGDRKKRDLTETEKIYYNGAKMLTQFHQTGHISPPRYAPGSKKPMIFSGPFAPIANQFLNYKKDLGLSKSSQRQYKRSFLCFFSYCQNRGVQSINSVTLSIILEYLNSLDATKRLAVYTALWTLRSFMKYLYEEKITRVDFSKQIPKYKSTSQPKLPSTYSKEEVEQLINSVNRSSSIGKRNYAFILLAARLGLRASDIALLKFTHLQWDANRICIKQIKTGKELILPLLADVGNAIIDYLKYGRPSSTSPFVFLSARPPYGSFPNSTVVTHVVQRAFRKAGINISNRKFGPHALRHSLSARLLEEKITLPVISEVLGHASTDTTRYYLRIDLTAMQQCMLDVPPISINFYQQKGGIFYEK